MSFKKEEKMKGLIVVLLAVMAFASAVYADVLIIVNNGVAENTLSQQEIQEIFLGKRVQWGDHSRIRFVTVGEPEVHSMFLKQYVKLSDSDWKIYWKQSYWLPITQISEPTRKGRLLVPLSKPSWINPRG